MTDAELLLLAERNWWRNETLRLAAVIDMAREAIIEQPDTFDKTGPGYAAVIKRMQASPDVATTAVITIIKRRILAKFDAIRGVNVRPGR